jgi:hypothetical protein
MDGLFDQDRLRQKVNDQIANSTDFLKRDRDHFLSPQDRWNRLHLDLNINDELIGKVIVLRETEPSVIIAEGLGKKQF